MQSKIKEILKELKRGSCWCEMAIGNPMVNGHSKGCFLAQELEKQFVENTLGRLGRQKSNEQ